MSRDGKRVATGSREAVKVWDVATGESIRSFSTGGADSIEVAVSDDGQHVALGSNVGIVRVWDVETGKQLWTRECAAWIVAIAVSGNLVVTCSDENTNVWHLTSGELLQTLRMTDAVAVAVHGQRAITSSDGTVRMWDVATGEELVRRRYGDAVAAITFIGDGSRVATVTCGEIEVWDASTGESLWTVPREFPRWSLVAASGDGRHVMTMTKDAVEMRNAGTGDVVWSLTENGYISMGGRILALGDGDVVQLWLI